MLKDKAELVALVGRDYVRAHGSRFKNKEERHPELEFLEWKDIPYTEDWREYEEDIGDILF